MIREMLVRRRMVMLKSDEREDRNEAQMLEQEFQQFKKAIRDEGLREGRREGRDEGLREGKVEDILRILSIRKLPLSAAEQERIRTCTDVAQLDRWLERAVIAVSVQDALAD